MADTYPNLTLRGVKGMFYRSLEEAQTAGWINSVATSFTSDQASEDYPWLGHSPSMREWVGERLAKQLPDYELTIRNRDFESGLEFKDRDLRRDKTGQMRIRIAELAQKAAILPQQLMTEVLVNNDVAYDGKAMFANDHVVGDSGTIDNLLAYDATDPADPTADEMVEAILNSVQAIMSFKDDTGEPLNDMAARFAIMYPTKYFQAVIAALRDEFTSSGVSNTLQSATGAGLQIAHFHNARLSANELFTFRLDTNVKSLIWQNEVGLGSGGVETSELSYGSDHYVKTDKHYFGVKRSCNAAPGRFEMAAKTVFS